MRAFGTQLLCEQVVGRGLRRRSYAVGGDGLLLPEYAEVYGVPFSFIPGGAGPVDPPPPPRMTRVRALTERADLEIRFPRFAGYRRELSDDALFASYDGSSTLTLSLADLPTSTTVRTSSGIRTLVTITRSPGSAAARTLTQAGGVGTGAGQCGNPALRVQVRAPVGVNQGRTPGGSARGTPPP